MTAPERAARILVGPAVTFDDLAIAALADGLAEGVVQGVRVLAIADVFEVEAAANGYALPSTWRIAYEDGREVAFLRIGGTSTNRAPF